MPSPIAGKIFLFSVRTWQGKALVFGREKASQGQHQAEHCLLQMYVAVSSDNGCCDALIAAPALIALHGAPLPIAQIPKDVGMSAIEQLFQREPGFVMFRNGNRPFQALALLSLVQTAACSTAVFFPLSLQCAAWLSLILKMKCKVGDNTQRQHTMVHCCHYSYKCNAEVSVPQLQWRNPRHCHRL